MLNKVTQADVKAGRSLSKVITNKVLNIEEIKVKLRARVQNSSKQQYQRQITENTG